MAIKRLQREAQFPCIGKLRKGGKKTPKKPGEDLTYFRFDTDDERAAEMFEQAYGKEPDTLPVYLPNQTVDGNFQAWQEAWLSGGLQHRCDGETCVLWLDGDKYSGSWNDDQMHGEGTFSYANGNIYKGMSRWIFTL